MDACPYDVIFFNEDLNLAQKCTGCAHLLDDGWAEPRCADACPTDWPSSSWTRMTPRSSSPRARCGSPELKDEVKPRVYYLEPAQEVHRRHAV